MPKKIWSSKANQKFGMDSPTKATLVETWSNHEYWRRAEYTPMLTPISSEKTMATPPRTTVLAMADWMSG